MRSVFAMQQTLDRPSSPLESMDERADDFFELIIDEPGGGDGSGSATKFELVEEHALGHGHADSLGFQDPGDSPTTATTPAAQSKKYRDKARPLRDVTPAWTDFDSTGLPEDDDDDVIYLSSSEADFDASPEFSPVRQLFKALLDPAVCGAFSGPDHQTYASKVTHGYGTRRRRPRSHLCSPRDPLDDCNGHNLTDDIENGLHDAPRVDKSFSMPGSSLPASSEAVAVLETPSSSSGYNLEEELNKKNPWSQ